MYDMSILNGSRFLYATQQRLYTPSESFLCILTPHTLGVCGFCYLLLCLKPCTFALLMRSSADSFRCTEALLPDEVGERPPRFARDMPSGVLLPLLLFDLNMLKR